ncbi:hypothetical protein [Streptomyces sp. NPDC090026]|uniref:hypothetical protein n=1 Tax=Streptomyces sp. NPDC090026 TaxID=3365923 RepID=UPI00382F2046
MPPGRRRRVRLTALLLALPGAAVAPLFSAQPAAATTATPTGGTVCMRSATDGVFRWDEATSWARITSGGSVGQIVPCEAVATTDPVEAGNGGTGGCDTAAPFSLSAVLLELRDRSDLTETEKLLLTQHLVHRWDRVFSLEASVCSAIERAKDELLAPVR